MMVAIGTKRQHPATQKTR